MKIETKDSRAGAIIAPVAEHEGSRHEHFIPAVKKTVRKTIKDTLFLL